MGGSCPNADCYENGPPMPDVTLVTDDRKNTSTATAMCYSCDASLRALTGDILVTTGVYFLPLGACV